MTKHQKGPIFMTALQFILLTAVTPLAEANDKTCSPLNNHGPVLIDEQCIDAEFSQPIIDSETEITQPVPLHWVSGHFAGTKVTFNFYFPPKYQWAGRFFHHVYPYTNGIPDDETLRFSAESGAYIVQTGTSSGYRADAAAAKFSRQVARAFYGIKNTHIYGYVYGGSGGSYQTIAAIENSHNIWDGAVPYVIGVPTSIPSNFFARAFARLVLNDASGQISDAMSPGGNNNPYAGLNALQRDALREVTKLGVPLRGWDNSDYLLGLQSENGLLGFQSTIKMIDPDYANDFWHKPGYLGTEQSAMGDFIRQSRIVQTIKVIASETRDNVLVLAHPPSRGFIQGAEYTLYNEKGITLGKVTGYLNESKREVTLDADTPAGIVANIKSVASVRLDNSWPIALTTYHRHQVPQEQGFDAWNQFRLANGNPVYPQRPVEAGPFIGNGASGGGKFTGQYTGKMIVIGNLLDMDAYPWQGDWYAQRVKSKLGSNYNEQFRIWINDNADHHDGSVIVSGQSKTDKIRLVSYVGILQQAIRDVSSWVEKGVAPADSTDYRLVDGQVALNPDPKKRNGIQPAVQLTVKGQKKIEVSPGQPVVLHGVINIPEGAGEITRVEWSRKGDSDISAVEMTGKGSKIEVTSPPFIYNSRGTYFPLIRVTLQREGKHDTSVATVQNIDRVRIIVR